MFVICVCIIIIVIVNMMNKPLEQNIRRAGKLPASDPGFWRQFDKQNQTKFDMSKPLTIEQEDYIQHCKHSKEDISFAGWKKKYYGVIDKPLPPPPPLKDWRDGHKDYDNGKSFHIYYEGSKPD